MPDLDLREYRKMQAWLGGEKPPAAGRTWRRQLQAVLPAPVRRVAFFLRPWSIEAVYLSLLGMFGFGGIRMLTHLSGIGPRVYGERLGGPSLPGEDALMVDSAAPWVVLACLLSLTLALSSWIIAGRDEDGNPTEARPHQETRSISS